jgi:hypothetical protein
MGDCTIAGGYIRYVAELPKPSAEMIRDMFTALAKTPPDINRVLTLVKQTPSLLNQQHPTYKSTLIESALFQINQIKNSTAQQPLVMMINEILTTKELFQKLDLSISSLEGNTALHRVFWYALQAQDTESCQMLVDIGLQMLGLLKAPQNFRYLYSIRNDFNETFLHCIFTNRSLPAQKMANLKLIQKQVIPFLNRYSVASTIDKYDFNKKNVRRRLEELLIDPVSSELFETPLILPQDGTTFSKGSWNSFTDLTNPQTKTKFKRDALKPNTALEAILRLYNTFTKEEDLCANLSAHFQQEAAKKGDFAQFETDDPLTQMIKMLVRSYNHSHGLNAVFVSINPLTIQRENIEKVSQILLELLSKMPHQAQSAERPQWTSSRTAARLQIVYNWLHSTDSLNDEKRSLVLKLIHDICRHKDEGNPSLTLFQPGQTEGVVLTHFKSLNQGLPLSSREFSIEEITRIEKDGPSALDQLIPSLPKAAPN